MGDREFTLTDSVWRVEFVVVDASGQFSLTVDPQDVPLQPPGPLPAGEMYFQAWHRDLNPAATSNFSSVIRVGFQ